MSHQKDGTQATRFPRHIPPEPALDRYRGCLLGGAVGDALGAPVEFLDRQEILRQFGPEGITEYQPTYGRLGAITDDTQMTLFTAEGVMRAYVRGTLRGICHPPSVIAYAYLRWLCTQGEDHPLHKHCLNGWLIQQRALFARRAPGLTCLDALKSLRSVGDRAHNDSKGCGGVMRVAPIGMFMATLTRARIPEEGLHRTFDLACEAAAITHGHPTGQLTAGVFAVVILQLLRDIALPEAIAVALRRLGTKPDSAETLTAIELACDLAVTRPGDVDAIRRLGEGWVAEEALAISLYCALSAEDLRTGTVMAVNHDGDSDSTGSMTGQLLGAMHGAALIPSSWLDGLELREVIEAMAQDLATVADWRLDDDEETEESRYYLIYAARP